MIAMDIATALSIIDRLREQLGAERNGHFKCASTLRELRDFCGSGFIPSWLEARIEEALNCPSKERVREVMADVDEMGLPDGAHWAMVHERLGLEYGDVFDIIDSDPDFFGAILSDGKPQPNPFVSRSVDRRKA
jgi:hypothetical protein